MKSTFKSHLGHFRKYFLSIWQYSPSFKHLLQKCFFVGFSIRSGKKKLYNVYTDGAASLAVTSNTIWKWLEVVCFSTWHMFWLSYLTVVIFVVCAVFFFCTLDTIWCRKISKVFCSFHTRSLFVLTLQRENFKKIVSMHLLEHFRELEIFFFFYDQLSLLRTHFLR